MCNKKEPITLSQELLIGSGGRRYCYKHPYDENLCIKVDQTLSQNDNQSSREIKYYSQYITRKIPHTHLTQFHGTINTSLGCGVIFDLVTDSDGSISRSLQHYLRQGMPIKKIEHLLDQLKTYLLNHQIHLSDLATDNILLNIKDREKKLVIIDGAVNSDFIKICDYSEHFRKKKIHRKWHRFFQSFNHIENTVDS